MIPFPLRWQLPRSPQNEVERLYAQAFHCLAGASWRMAAAHSRLSDYSYALAKASGVPPVVTIDRAMAEWRFADELIEGAGVYLQLRADLREPAPTA